MSDTATVRGRRRLDGLRGQELVRVVGVRALIIIGLSGMAVTQPLLDLFGSNPEFFVAGNYSSGQIVGFALAIATVPSLAGIGISLIGALVDRRAGAAVFAAVVVFLGVAFGLAVARTLGIEPIVLAMGLAVLFGVSVCVGVLRTRGVRLLLSYLAAANLLFVALFLFASPASRLVAGDASTFELGDTTVPELEAPVVVIVLDEFPAATIMRGDGSLNGDRYPNLERLTETSTWFRNASSTHNLTPAAVPPIFTGTVAGESAMPTYSDHPRTLFSLLGQSSPVHRYESVTDLCPPNVCEQRRREPLRQAIDDAVVVYGHRVLPGSLREGLPAIDNSWGAYGASDGGSGTWLESIDEAYERWHGRSADEQSPTGQAAVMRDHIEMVTGEPALHVIHVALPHRPWTLSRTGIATLHTPDPPTEDDADEPDYDARIRLEYQLHSMQVGAADALIGELLDRLQSLPTWDETLLVVTSDHGTNLNPPDVGRMTVTDENREEVYRVPLFVKAPGQAEGDGEVRDDVASTLDVTPSIVDLLGVELDSRWEFDGRSLYDGSSLRTDPLVSPAVGEVLAIAEAREEEFPHGDDWLGLAAVGTHGDLVGSRVAEIATGPASGYSATLDQADVFDDLPTADGRMPFVLTGRVWSDDDEADPPGDLLVSTNGTIAGVVGGDRPDGDGWSFIGYVADIYEQGSNAVELYEVRGAGGERRLHHLR